MSEDAIRQAIENFLSSGWNSSIPIAWDNVDFTSKTGEAYIEPILSCVHTSVISMKCHRGTYLLTIIVRTPKGTGDKPNLDICDTLIQKFAGKYTAGIQFKTARQERMGNMDNWHQRKVLIDFTYNSIIG